MDVFNLGCGQRGQNYAAMALDFPERLQVPTGSSRGGHQHLQIGWMLDIDLGGENA
jgi:hypothetical protein